MIPISRPAIGHLEVEFVKSAVESTWVSSQGKYIDSFESSFAEFCGTTHAICTSNGTVALHLALIAAGIGKGDEVIVPDLSFIASANAVLYTGAKPVFVDIDPLSLCVDCSAVEAAITPRTKAIMPVHLYGHPADMPEINRIAKSHDLFVVEDAAEALGASVNGKRVGGWGDCATFSFYGNKIITTGEGGMITTDDKALADRMRYLRDHAKSKDKHYWHDSLGYNYRMTNMQAALGCAQMQRLDQFLEKRREIFLLYSMGFENAIGVSLNKTYEWALNSYWLICLECESINAANREVFMKKLLDKGVDTRPYFYPMSTMPYIKSDVINPNCIDVSARGINLPTYYDLSPQDIDIVVDVVITTLRELVNGEI